MGPRFELLISCREMQRARRRIARVAVALSNGEGNMVRDECTFQLNERKAYFSLDFAKSARTTKVSIV